MGFGSSGGDEDETRILVDGIEVFDNIPKVMFRIKGRTPLGWAIKNYQFKQNKMSKISNNSAAGVDPIDLIKRMVYVGVKSDEIITDLAKCPFPVLEGRGGVQRAGLREWGGRA